MFKLYPLCPYCNDLMKPNQAEVLNLLSIRMVHHEDTSSLFAKTFPLFAITCQQGMVTTYLVYEEWFFTPLGVGGTTLAVQMVSFCHVSFIQK